MEIAVQARDQMRAMGQNLLSSGISKLNAVHANSAAASPLGGGKSSGASGGGLSKSFNTSEISGLLGGGGGSSIGNALGGGQGGFNKALGTSGDTGFQSFSKIGSLFGK